MSMGVARTSQIPLATGESVGGRPGPSDMVRLQFRDGCVSERRAKRYSSGSSWVT